MTHNLFSLISMLLNTLLAFFTAAFVIELILTLCQIKQYRTRAFLRLIPFCGLLIDRLFSELSLFNWLNPLYCNSCMQKFMFQLFFPDLQAYLAKNDLSLITHLASSSHYLNSKAPFISFFLLTCAFIAWKLFRIFFQSRQLHSVLNNGTIFQSIENPLLAAALKKYRIRIILSDEIPTPIATYNNRIIIPRVLAEKMSPNELEVIIAHELEHIRLKDPLSRLYSQCVSTIFWWIPTQWWEKKMIQEQEMACDQSILAYGLDSETLAASLVKATKLAKMIKYEMACPFASKEKSSLIRLKALLGQAPTVKNMTIPCCICTSLGLLLILACFLEII